MKPGWRALQRTLMLGLVAGALGAASPTMAATIVLSNGSNDPAVDFSDFDATLNFELTDPNTLTLSVSNDSAGFDITGLYFNSASAVTDLTLVSGLNHWKLVKQGSKGNPTDAGQFGTFHYAVSVTGKDAGKDKLQPGEGATFVFDIVGIGPFSASDFATALTAIDAGESGALAAAKFGTGKNSPLGIAHTPEPATGLLLGMGICVLAAQRKLRS